MKILRLLFFLLCSWCTVTASAQQFSALEKAQGYSFRNDTAYFVFDAKLYNRFPASRVVVTGAFRGWTHDLDDKAYQLKAGADSVWAIGVFNPGHETVKPSSPFKFRVDEGDWLSPPAGTPNEEGGNLVYLKGIDPPGLRAEYRNANAIWAVVTGMERPLDPKAYRLTNGKGEEIKIAAILPNTASETLIIPAEPIDIKRLHYLEIPKNKLKTACSYDGWFRHLYSDKELGANISADGKTTAFRVFSPRAQKIKLYLYKNANDTEAQAYQVIDMVQDEQGVWEAIVEGNLKGVYYDFTVHGPDEKGNHFYGTKVGNHPFGTAEGHISDPYARVSLDTWGKCRVWEKTKPATPLKNGIPAMESVIAYEVHVQDFTDNLPVSNDLKGTLPAMYKSGLKNSAGAKIGFDYLTDLGINTVHLMPVQEFLNYPDSLWAASFKNDKYMIEQGIATENYQWGYRTSHCFAVESRFRQKGTEPGAERNQFRDLVQAFHDKGIAVIIDIVPNHSAENMDGQAWNFHFNALDKVYYYRTKEMEHIGEYGNELKTEDRPMTQRWLIDQCKHFIEEFGIDGFRIDLAGQIDEQTLIKLRNAVGPDIIIYGEPWIGSNDPRFEANPDWDWYKKDSPITFFQDDSRNAFKGPTSNPSNKEKDRGYAGGDVEMRDKVKLGLSNKFPEDDTPIDGINYLDIHDNWALADRFAKVNYDGRFGVDEDRFMLAAVMLYTSLGPIVTHGGTEMMRSKALGPLEELVKETTNGIKVYIHGKRDTYNLRYANQFIWSNAGTSPGNKTPDIRCDYDAMYKFWQGLNKFRMSEMGSVFRQSKAVPEGYYRWFEPENKALLGYLIDDKVLVLLNVSNRQGNFYSVELPEGKWKLIANNSGIDHIKGVKGKYRNFNGGSGQTIVLDATSFGIWVKQ